MKFVFSVCLIFLASELYAQDPPENLKGIYENEQVMLQWDPAPGAIAYNVYRDDQYIKTTADTSYTEQLEAGSSATFYVVAFSAPPTRYSPRGEVVRIPAAAEPTDSNIPPSVPTNLSGDIAGAVATIRWDAPSNDEQVAGYNVYVNGEYTDTVFTNRWSGSVEGSDRYSFSIVAFDVRRNFSASSSSLTLQETAANELDTTAPGLITALRGSISGTGSGEVVLSWQAPADASDVAGYNVYRDNEYLTTVFSTGYRGPVDDVNRIHRYYIVSFDFNQNFSKRSDALELPSVLNDGSGTDDLAPGAPSALSGTLADTGEFTLQWSASSDNIRVAGYNVYADDRYVATVTGTSYSRPAGEEPAGTYYVVAFDDARNFSSRSETFDLSSPGNTAPFFPDLPDTIALAGDTTDIVIAPFDPDGTVPGLLLGQLPTGMRSVDNFDGTRSLRWRPLQPDVGSYKIEATAIDASEPGLRSTQSFTLTVELPDDPSTIINLPPGINLVEDAVLRAGDTVIMEVKGTDPNGTIPDLTLLNPPEGATFLPHPEFEDIKVLRWTTDNSDLGITELNFRAVDAVDASLPVAAMDVQLDVRPPGAFARPGERLKILAATRDRQIGYASVLQFYNRPDSDLYQTIVSEEFNLVTPENSMKWGYVNPEPGVYRWEAADRLMQFAIDSGMDVHGHTLVWYADLPQWVQQSPLSRREGLMYEFIDTMTSRYPDVAIWDVVNEAFEEDGSYRNSTWFQAMGKDYIPKAFVRTHERVPQATLIYNDYNIAYAGPKSDATFQLMQELVEADVPVDGIGFQMHIDTSFDQVGSVEQRFSDFAALGLDIYITEFDVSVVDGGTEDDQARLYREITTVCLRQPACKALQFWGITDRYSWRGQFDPLLLTRDYEAKPAYRAVQQALQAR